MVSGDAKAAYAQPPMGLWHLLGVQNYATHCTKFRRLHGRTPLEQLMGETPDISEYLDFSFYNWCWYNDNAGLGETKLGSGLGMSHHVGMLGHMGLVPHPAQGLMRDSHVLTSWIPPSPHRHVAGRPIPTRIRPPPFRDRWHMAGRPILTHIRPPPSRGQQSPRSLL